jgi:phosphoribosyl 1,2-cyclic phosphodiesterase
MRIRFWGVRGSLPSPGPDTVRYGGNTPCVAVELGSLLLVFDAGTGIRRLGDSLTNWDGEICIVVSHLHWDHVQGLPFFAPLYGADRPLTLCVPPGQASGGLIEIAGMDGLHFPVVGDQVASRIAIRDDLPNDLLERHGARLHSLAVNHPGGTRAFRLEAGGRSLVHIPDNEIDPPYARAVEPGELVEFCRGADLLIHDAQYLPHELAAKRGWGHSEVSQVCDLAAAADVARLCLFHHDPARSDAELDVIGAGAGERLRRGPKSIVCEVAAESDEPIAIGGLS